MKLQMFSSFKKIPSPQAETQECKQVVYKKLQSEKI